MGSASVWDGDDRSERIRQRKPVPSSGDTQDGRVFGVKVPELGPGRHDMVQASDLQALREQLNGRAATLEMMVDNPLARQEARWLRSLSGEEWGERVCPECGEPDEGNDAHDGECSQIFPYLSPSELAVYKKLRPCFAEVIRRESGEEE